MKQPVSASLELAPTNKSGKALGLTVRGDEVRVGWRFPSVRFSVRRIIIHFEVADCTIPPEDWAYDALNVAELDVEHEVAETTENTLDRKTEWSAVTAANSSSVSAGYVRSRAIRRGRQDNKKLSTRVIPILAHGTAVRPRWTITSEIPSKPLLGTLLKHPRFCRAEPNGPEPKVTVSFEIPYDGLLYRRWDGQYTNGNKFGMIRLLLRASLCERKQPLCEINIQTET